MNFYYVPSTPEQAGIITEASILKAQAAAVAKAHGGEIMDEPAPIGFVQVSFKGVIYLYLYISISLYWWCLVSRSCGVVH